MGAVISQVVAPEPSRWETVSYTHLRAHETDQYLVGSEMCIRDSGGQQAGHQQNHADVVADVFHDLGHDEVKHARVAQHVEEHHGKGEQGGGVQRAVQAGAQIALEGLEAHEQVHGSGHLGLGGHQIAHQAQDDDSDGRQNDKDGGQGYLAPDNQGHHGDDQNETNCG